MAVKKYGQPYTPGIFVRTGRSVRYMIRAAAISEGMSCNLMALQFIYEGLKARGYSPSEPEGEAYNGGKVENFDRIAARIASGKSPSPLGRPPRNGRRT